MATNAGHEATHVVVGHELGLRVVEVTIDEDRAFDALKADCAKRSFVPGPQFRVYGHVLFEDLPSGLDVANDQDDKELVNRRIMAELAGDEFEKRSRQGEVITGLDLPKAIGIARDYFWQRPQLLRIARRRASATGTENAGRSPSLERLRKWLSPSSRIGLFLGRTSMLFWPAGLCRRDTQKSSAGQPQESCRSDYAASPPCLARHRHEFGCPSVEKNSAIAKGPHEKLSGPRVSRR